MPMIRPCRSTSGPPELPGLIDGVGLDEILVALDAEPGAAERADDPRGHGLTEAERIADREDEIADLQAIGITHRHRRQTTGGDLQHGDIGLGIAADQPRLETPIVLCGDLDAGGVFDDVSVGQYIALRGVDDHAGTGRLGLALDRLLLLQVEEAPEQRILQQRVVLAHPTAHRDADDARRHPADDRGDGLHRSAADLGYRRACEGRR